MQILNWNYTTTIAEFAVSIHDWVPGSKIRERIIKANHIDGGASQIAFLTIKEFQLMMPK